MDPYWSRGSDELYYHLGDKMMVVQVATQPAFSAGRPEMLFQGDFEFSPRIRNYDVAPDGRFLMVRTPPESAARTMVLVLNWFEELNQLVPVD